MYSVPVSLEREVIEHFRTSLQSGRNWYVALLEAIRDFPDDCYMVGGEALHWTRLVRMLVDEAGDLIPRGELTEFLGRGKPPVKLTPSEARECLGPVKYNCYLNYLYGVTVETALLSAVVAEAEKETRSLGICRHRDEINEAFLRIYSCSEAELRSAFLLTSAGKHSGWEVEFTYWLFKHRLKSSDKEKVASDTKKGLDWLGGEANFFPRLF